MENNNWRPAQGETPSMEVPSSDWRSQLQPEARQRIVNKIMDTLRRHLPVASPEGMTELKKIAVRFEEKIHAAAVNQTDYLRKISFKMLSMETKTLHNTPMNSQPGVNQNSTDTGSLAIPPQVNSQGQPLPQIPLVGPPSGRQQLVPQNVQNNSPASMQGSSSLSASPAITGLTQSTITNFGHTSNMQNMPGISHSSINNSLAQGTTTDIYANAQRHMQGRQQQSQNPLIYQNQLQPQLMKKIHNNALLPSSMQQQQQQSLLQTSQLQPSQQSTMQIPSGLTSGQTSIQQPPVTSIQSASQPALQQNQLNAIQQLVSPLLSQHVQAFARQSQQPQSSLHQQTNLQTQQQQQQQQLIGQQANMKNIQQNQLLGQQNSIVDIKQQQQRLPVQANNLINMQQSQQLLNQQSLSLHQQQLGQQTNMQGLQQQQQPQSQQQQQPQSQQQQQQLLGSLYNISNMQSHQRSIQLLQQSKNMSQTQEQLQQPSTSLLQPQGQQSHHLSSQQQLISQFQSQGQFQQSLAMEQQSNSMQRDMQQRISSGTLLRPQSAMKQQMQFMQSQSGSPEVSSSTQTGPNGADWQEEIYQKIQAMKEAHLAELQEFLQKISQRYQQSEMMPHAKQSGNFEKLKSFKVLLERVLAFLQISENSITIGLKEKLPTYEKQIIGLLNTNNEQKIMPLPLQGQQQLHHPGGLAQSTPQHQPSQVLQVQQRKILGNQVHQFASPAIVKTCDHEASAIALSREARLLRYIQYLRLSVVFATLLAAVSMGFSKQTDQFMAYNSLTGKAIYISLYVKATDSSSFVYFIFANVLVFVYSVVVTVLSFIKKYGTRLHLSVVVIDLVALAILSTANAAAAVTEEVAWNGNSHYNWNKFCNLTTNFCGNVMASNVISTMAATIYFAMVVLSIVIIQRRSQY